ncbi:twin-arginine translocation signal domain-containing protein [Haloarchaeobius amylolyticus]|uniref:twin-arginine translocation signal domain-containing protein n=1 Tax=Haloarchaeobius amylolyticus TaxID=1198296 RepID=UPI0022716C3C|nr:twin-arginine translocation signal domain-containing protein [Haloarchaeobius amylolyticus]
MTHTEPRGVYRRKLLKTVGVGLAAVAVGSQTVSAKQGQSPAVAPGQKPTEEQFGAYWGGPWGEYWRTGGLYDPHCDPCAGYAFWRSGGYRGRFYGRGYYGSRFYGRGFYRGYGYGPYVRFRGRGIRFRTY